MLRILGNKELFRWKRFHEATFTRTTLPKHCPDRHDVKRYEKTSAGPLRQVVDVTELDADARDIFKKSCPLVSFRESCSKARGTVATLNYIQGIVADFDGLPPGFQSYDELEAHLTERHPDALVFRSPTAKTKAVWFVRTYRKSINVLEAVNFLHTRIPDLIEDIDTSTAGLSTAFMDASALARFQEFAERWGEDDSFVCKLPRDEKGFDYNTPESTHLYKEAPYTAIPRPLEEAIMLMGYGRRDVNLEAFRRLFQILIACPTLLTDGFGLSTSVLGRQLGVSNVTASAWLRRLCDLGFLRWIGNKPVRGRTAKIYVAVKGILIRAIEDNKKVETKGDSSSRSTSRGLADVVVTAHSEKGSGYAFRGRVATFAAIHGYSVEELVETVETHIPGFFTERVGQGKTNDRRKQLIAAFGSAQRKFVLKAG